MKKGIIIAIVVVAGAAGIYLILNQNKAHAPVSQDITIGETQTQTNQTIQNQPQNQATSSSSLGLGVKASTTVTTKPSEGTFSKGEEESSPDVQVVKVTYDGSKFTPSIVDIKVNDWVFFENKGTADFWPASAPHPTHTNYPEFDAKKAISPGGSFKFQFTKEGSWGFHDHLNPQAFGKVTVAK